MVETDWFWVTKDKEALGIKGTKNLSQKRFPYFMDREAFDTIEDGTAFYQHEDRGEYSDILFEPTFMFSDRFQRIFRYLEPEMELKSLHLIDQSKREKAPVPLYWIPFLSYTDAIHETSSVVQGKAERLVLKGKAMEGRRIVHCRLPADDIWLFSLEAAECILRRSPLGILLKKIETVL